MKRHSPENIDDRIKTFQRPYKGDEHRRQGSSEHESGEGSGLLLLWCELIQIDRRYVGKKL